MNDLIGSAGVIDALRGVAVSEPEVLDVRLVTVPPDADGLGHDEGITTVDGRPIRFDLVTTGTIGWSLRNSEPIYFDLPDAEPTTWYLVAQVNGQTRYFGRTYPISAGVVATGRVRINTESFTLQRRPAT